ncbi:hypothetical protein B0H13DRAFT_2333804 [Mycena leptocephala]|nr:hypothetical protein B0H13DRAFT_2333804 [Mycena leptocephala]
MALLLKASPIRQSSASGMHCLAQKRTTASLASIALAILDALSTLNGCCAVCIPVSFYVTNSIVHGFQDYAPSDATLLDPITQSGSVSDASSRKRFKFGPKNASPYTALIFLGKRTIVASTYANGADSSRKCPCKLQIFVKNPCRLPHAINPQDPVAFLFHPFQAENFAPYTPTSRALFRKCVKVKKAFLRNFTCTFNDARGAPMFPLYRTQYLLVLYSPYRHVASFSLLLAKQTLRFTLHKRFTLCTHFAPPHELVTRTPALDDAHQSVDTLGILLICSRCTASHIVHAHCASPHELVTRTPALDDAHQSVDTLGMLLRRGRFVLAESVLSNLFAAQRHTLCTRLAPPPHELVTRIPALDNTSIRRHSWHAFETGTHSCLNLNRSTNPTRA